MYVLRTRNCWLYHSLLIFLVALMALNISIILYIIIGHYTGADSQLHPNIRSPTICGCAPDAIVSTTDQFEVNAYMFKEDKYWEIFAVTKELVIKNKTPRKIREEWRGLPWPIRAAFQYQKYFYFIREQQYFIFDKEKRLIKSGLTREWHNFPDGVSTTTSYVDLEQHNRTYIAAIDKNGWRRCSFLAIFKLHCSTDTQDVKNLK